MTIGLVNDPQPWVCMERFIASSMILPSTKPSTMGGRGQPPSFMKYPMKPNTSRAIQLPSVPLPTQAPMKTTSMMAGTMMWPCR